VIAVQIAGSARANQLTTAVNQAIAVIAMNIHEVSFGFSSIQFATLSMIGATA
jgi:hypothetical protein